MALIELGMTKSEAEAVLKDDKRVDRGEKLFELTNEQKQNAKQARNGAKLPTVYKFTPREHKPNEAKQEIINALAQAVEPLGAVDVNIEHKERIFSFSINGVKYKITLSLPRS